MEISKIAASALTGITLTNIILTPINNHTSIIGSKSPGEVFDFYIHSKAKDFSRASFKGFSSNFKVTCSKELLFIIITESFKLKLGFKNFLIQFGVGAVSGIAETVVTYPNGYCKSMSKLSLTRQACSNSGIMKSSEKWFREIVLDEGFLGLYRGSRLFFLSNILFNGFFHLGYSIIQSKLKVSWLNALPRIGSTLILYFCCNFTLAVLNKWKYSVREKTVL